MRIRKWKSMICNDEGSAIGLFVVIILSMTLLATASITLAQTQYSWARFSRQTSNSYHLARSGAEKIVDTMNKEIATVLPDMMKEASEAAHLKLLNPGGVKYDGTGATDAYTGKYVGTVFENEYERQLKKLMYEHIEATFALAVAPDPAVPPEIDYEAVKSDMKDPVDIKVQTNVYKNGTTGVSADIAGLVGDLVTSAEIDTLDEVALAKKDAFAVEVIAWAEEGSKSTLTKSRLIGTISIDQLNREEELIEEYGWTGDKYPEIFQSAVVSFGDFIINGPYKKTQINGDISVKGTRAETDALNLKFPEPVEFGGIVISDGGELKVVGNALVVNNIQTTNDPTNSDKTTALEITKDAIAETIAINDNAQESIEPWKTVVENNSIKIGRNVYMENDLRIDRYVKGGQIEVGESVFGVSDGDKDAKVDPSTGIEYVDPNKASGIYAMGKLSDDDSKIKMSRAFIAGEAYINFGDGKGFHKLHESIGEPFEDVYYLDEYRMAYGEELDKGDGSPKIIGGDSAAYTTDLADLIRKDRIIISQNSAYATKLISTLIPTNVPANFMAKEIFYKGLVGGSFPSGIKAALTGQQDWDEHILGIPTDSTKITNPTWEDLLLNPLHYYAKDNNPFRKDYKNGLPDSAFGAYQGLHGYMLGKRGVFYEHFIAGGAAGVIPKEREFKDLINVDVFTEKHKWSQNNPIEVITDPGVTTVDISEYKKKPTAIICTNRDTVLKLTSSSEKKFTGIIVTPGKIIIADEMTINGVVIAGKEYDAALDPVAPTTETIRTGDYAGIQITTNEDVVFNYNPANEKELNMIFAIRFMDKSLQRKLYDSLGMTDYASLDAPGAPSDDVAKIDAIFGSSGARQVELSDESVISSNQDGLQFTMKSLKKIKN